MEPLTDVYCSWEPRSTFATSLLDLPVCDRPLPPPPPLLAAGRLPPRALPPVLPPRAPQARPSIPPASQRGPPPSLMLQQQLVEVCGVLTPKVELEEMAALDMAYGWLDYQFLRPVVIFL